MIFLIYSIKNNSHPLSLDASWILYIYIYIYIYIIYIYMSLLVLSLSSLVYSYLSQFLFRHISIELSLGIYIFIIKVIHFSLNYFSGSKTFFSFGWLQFCDIYNSSLLPFNVCTYQTIVIYSYRIAQKISNNLIISKGTTT